MYLTRTYINPRRRGALPFLGSPQKVHAAVMQAFPVSPTHDGSGKARVLWRLDSDDPRHPVLWTVSPDRPDMHHVVEPYGWPESDRPFETRPYGPLLDRLAEGQRYVFRVTVNPVKSRPPTRSEDAPPGMPRTRSPRVPLVGTDHQIDWFAGRAEKWGFRLPPGRLPHPQGGDRRAYAVEIRENKRLRFWRNGDSQPVVLRTITLQGLLEVYDATILRSALCAGIGRAKGYGCGLMSLAPPASQPATED